MKKLKQTEKSSNSTQATEMIQITHLPHWKDKIPGTTKKKSERKSETAKNNSNTRAAAATARLKEGQKRVEWRPHERGLVPAELLFELTPLAELALLLLKALAFPEFSPVRAANNPVVHSDK